MPEHYLVISSDCHAGPETPEYRPYLDPEYRERFDESLVEREALLAQMRESSPFAMGGDDEFQEEWFGHDEGEESLHEGGLRCGWDAPKRDQRARQRRCRSRGDLPRPRRRDREHGCAVRRRPRDRRRPRPRRSCSPAHARTTAGAPSCARTHPSGARASRSRRSSATSTARSPRSGAPHESGLHGGVLIPAQWGDYPSYAHDLYDPVWAVCEELSMPVHTHSGPGARQDYGTGEGFYGHVRRARPAGGRPARCGSCSARACSSASRA